MRRHLQPTFCMGQCVSSCGSKRTLDSVPTTPDTEFYPGLTAPSPRSTSISKCSSCNYQVDNLTQPYPPFQSVGLGRPRGQSSAAKFVTAFSQKKIIARRINPGESPVHIKKPSPSRLPHKSSKSSPVVSQDGDMKGKPVKNYFRETISSAKKSSVKSVTFSSTEAATPPPTSSIPKRHFFSFSTTLTAKSKKEQEQDICDKSTSKSKGFLKKKGKKRAPDVPVKPLKEKQICRVTLSPKQGSSKEQSSFIYDEEKVGSGENDQNKEQEDNQQTMGNAPSAGNGVELANIIKSSSTTAFKGKQGDINENTQNLQNSHTLSTSKSVDSPGLIRKNENVLRNLNSIKEENRLLRLKFFLEDTSKPEVSAPVGQENSGFEQSSSTTMQRQYVRSAIPKPGGSKPSPNVSGIPKLYSVGSTDQLDSGKIRLKIPTPSKLQQPTNINSGWVNASKYFEASDSTSPNNAAAKGNRRVSEPPKGLPGALRDRGQQGPIDERRGTVGYPSKLPGVPGVSIPRIVKTSVVTTATAGTSIADKASKFRPTNKVGVQKPILPTPFFVQALSYNRPSATTEPPKPFPSGFQSVSTGVVKQRMQQFQSKVEASNKVVAGHSGVREPSPAAAPDDSPSKRGLSRSETYTVRKYGPGTSGGPSSQLRANTDVDRYRTYTRKGQNKNIIKNRDGQAENRRMNESSMSDASGGSIGYPLQHDRSGTSTSSMGTNEDGIGDHVVISDSEYLIDDEISDQPELTLTFKDSSLKLSPSTSGESLVSSDIMLDHLDLSADRILGELTTSDSAISDISTHNKSASHCISNLSKLPSAKISSSPSSLLDQSSKLIELRSKIQSPSDTSSPSSVRTVRHPKSPRRISKLSTSAHSSPSPKSGRQAPDSCIPKVASSSSNSNLSGKSSSPAKPPQQKEVGKTSPHHPISGKPSHARSILTSPPSLSPVNQIKSAIAKKDTQVVGLTIENVSRLHKQYEHEDSVVVAQSSSTDNEGGSINLNVPFASVPFIEELLGGFQEMKTELETLKVQLESQQKREREKDELILRLSGQVDRLKSLLGNDHQRNGNINEDFDKERYISRSLNYENAAVQTDNNNIFNRAVTYPEEEDKYGELVRIGRSSSLKKKL